MDYMYWGFVVDKSFFYDILQNFRKKGEFKNVLLMISFNSNEGVGVFGIMVNLFYIGFMQSVDNGISKVFFKIFLVKYVQV